VVVGIAKSKTDGRTPPGSKESDQGLQLRIPAHAGPGIEPKPRLRPVRIARLKSARAGDDVGRKAGRNARLLTDLDREQHVIEWDHVPLLSEYSEPVAKHLRERPEEHFRASALRGVECCIQDVAPLLAVGAIGDESRDIMLFRR